jgi:hypothetical protein
MNILLKITAILIITTNTLLQANTHTIKEIKKNEILIGYYGRPNTYSLGILGENNINNLVLKMKNKKAYFIKELDNSLNVKLAFHIIYSLATKDAGRRNDYLLHMNNKTVMKYINKAKEENFSVILDVQLAVKTPKQALQPLLKYLKYDNVHLAIDPEFKIPRHRRYAPGKFIGHVKADELNEAQELINTYLINNKIQEKKKLIVHMFHEKMLRNKQDVKDYNNIDLVYNIDGHGRRDIKIKTYNHLYARTQTQKALGGFKIFRKADNKVMTPKQIIGLEAINDFKIAELPYYINYH